MLSLVYEELGINLSTDIEVRSPNFYLSIYSSGLLGLGESYMRGEWVEKEKSLDELSSLACSSNIQEKIRNCSWRTKLAFFLNYLYSKLTFFPDSTLVASVHYDLGNELYQGMLGATMNYSCALFSRNGQLLEDLDSAQEMKMAVIAEKLHPEKGTKILDIGCGFGSLAFYLAEKYQVEVTGVTVSKEQYNYMLEKKKELDCSRTHFLLCDYKELKEEKYKAIVSVGMFEHVGSASYDEFMKKVNSLLLPGGVFLLHSIANIKPTTLPDPWINKYIFPNSSLPSLGEICLSSQPYFVVEDVENLSVNYDKTLLCWYDNFTKNWKSINKERRKRGKEELDEKFFRMWKYYLLICAGSFRARRLQVYQVVFSKQPKNGYIRV